MTTVDWMAQMAERHVLFERLGDKLRVECYDVLAVEVRAEAVGRKHEILAILDRDWCAAATALLSRLSPECGNGSDEDLSLQFLERAAICEFDGGLLRADAERLAYLEIATAAVALKDSS